jgi:hypothetical protein
MPVSRSEYDDLYATVAESLEGVSGLEGEELPVNWSVYSEGTVVDGTYEVNTERSYESSVAINGYYIAKDVMQLASIPSSQFLEVADLMLIVSAQEMAKIESWSSKDRLELEGYYYDIVKHDPVVYGGPLVYLFYLKKQTVREQVEAKVTEANVEQTPLIEETITEDATIGAVTPISGNYAKKTEVDYSDVF